MTKLGEKVRRMVRNWLNIQPAMEQSITIMEPTTFETSVIKNKIWYRGDGEELLQLYRQLGGAGDRFWASVPQGEKIRKLHSGLPALIVDTLAYIVKSDLAPAEFDGTNAQQAKEIWACMEKDLEFAELVAKAVSRALVCGDGAFKISIDTDISPYPLCEFFSAENVEYGTLRGQTTAVRFYTDFEQSGRICRLEECYSRGAVEYHAWDGTREIPLDNVPHLAGLKNTTFTGNYIMAVPFQIYDNTKFVGRGKSIFETKTDCFDAHDEVISQWVDAIRKGRVQRYIPEDLIPRDADTGALKRVNSFGSEFITVETGVKETDSSKIQIVQPQIDYEAYLNTYTATLDMCLQGIISPATLGIDLGKMASADAQREKKDVTGHTRNTITSALERALPKLIVAMLQTYDNMQNKAPQSYEVSVSFGEYGAPDFDSRAEVVNKAASAGTMSVEAQVDELWGDSHDKEWKRGETARIMRERGLLDAEMPAVGDELNDMA